MATKNYYFNDSLEVSVGMKPYTDLGYSIPIPWNDVYSTGWVDGKPTHAEGEQPWGTENKMIAKPDPEFFAPDGIVRSNVMPQININDPIYHYSRKENTYRVW